MHERDTFDTVAEVYDAARPGYPEPLFDDIAAIAGLRRGDPVLEVGCGSGQASGGLLARGCRVTALDPGPALIAAAERRFSGEPRITFVTARFEAWEPPPRSFRLVASAQAWHWIPPDEAFARAARAMKPDGWLAVIGNTPVEVPEGFKAVAEPLYRRHAPELWAPAPESWYLPAGPVSALFAASGRFGPAIHRCHPWSWRHTAASFMAFLRSRSDFQVLPAARREPLIAALSELVSRRGNLEIGYETHLYMAPLV